MDELHELKNGIVLFNNNGCTEFQLYIWVILVTGKAGSFYLFSINILLGDGLAITNTSGLKSPGNIKTPYYSYLF